MVDQADVGCDDIRGYGDFSGDALVAGLGVVAFVGDWADDVDAACTGQVGGATFGQRDVEVMREAVVLDDGAVAVGGSVQAFAVAVCGNVVAE